MHPLLMAHRRRHQQQVRRLSKNRNRSSYDQNRNRSSYDQHSNQQYNSTIYKFKLFSASLFGILFVVSVCLLKFVFNKKKHPSTTTYCPQTTTSVPLFNT